MGDTGFKAQIVIKVIYRAELGWLTLCQKKVTWSIIMSMIL